MISFSAWRHTCLTTLAAVCLFAGAAHADPFTDALISAYESNPRIKAERQGLQALDETVNQAISGWRPTLSADFQEGRQRNSFQDGDETYSDADAKVLSVEQPLFSGGGTWAQMKSAKHLIKAGRAQLSGVEQQVLLDAVRAYMDVVQAQSVLELSRNNLEVLGQQLKAAKDRFDVGEVTRTDVAQAEARSAQAQSELSEAEGLLGTARATFKRVIGYDAPRILPPPPARPALPATLEEALEIAKVTSPLLERAEHQAKSAQYDVYQRMSVLSPSLTLNGAMRSDDNAGTQGNQSLDTDEITLNMHIPLYQSGSEYSRVRQAKATLRQRKFGEIDAADTMREQVVSAWEDLQTSRATIVSNQSAIKAAQIALDGVKQEQQYGARTTLDVLDQEQELFRARVNLVRSQRNEVVAVYTLLGVLGQLLPINLDLNVETYNPKENYNDVKYKFIGF